MNEVRLGDYVVASNSKAGNPAERWTCGIVVAIGQEEVVRTGKITRYARLQNSEVRWRYCATITPKLAEDLPGMVEFNPTGRSIWQMRRQLMSTGAADPTPEEIWGRLTKEIQAGWTEQDRLDHVVGPDYRLPVMQVVPVGSDRRTMDIDFNH
jgi:hypothetical protein